MSLDEEIEISLRLVERQKQDPDAIGIVRLDEMGGKILSMYRNTVYLTHGFRPSEDGTWSCHCGLIGSTPVTQDGIRAGTRVIELDDDGEPLFDYIAVGDEVDPTFIHEMLTTRKAPTGSGDDPPQTARVRTSSGNGPDQSARPRAVEALGATAGEVADTSRGPSYEDDPVGVTTYELQSSIRQHGITEGVTAYFQAAGPERMALLNEQFDDPSSAADWLESRTRETAAPTEHSHVDAR